MNTCTYSATYFYLAYLKYKCRKRYVPELTFSFVSILLILIDKSLYIFVQSITYIFVMDY